MDCRRVDDLLPAFLEDSLPIRRAQEIARHLAACARCRRERRAMESALGALERVSRHTPSIDLWASFAERLAAERTSERSASPRRFGWVARSLAGCAAGAVAAAACAA